MIKQAAILVTATALAFGAGMIWERGSFAKGPVTKPSLDETETASETVSNPDVDSQVAERADIEQLKMHKRVLLQQVVRLIKEREALKLEKADCAAREATAIRERDEAVHSKDNAIRVAADAIFAENEARRAQDVALSTVEEANSVTDKAIKARDEAVQAKREAVQRRKRVQSGVKKVIDQHQEQAQLTIDALTREKTAAVLARDKALLGMNALGQWLLEMWGELSALRNQNSLRSITMNPPQ